jgi:5-hydroxyisourate hydrolase-like protein (transthyretin family)
MGTLNAMKPFMAVLAVAAALIATPALPASGGISGRVTDASTGSPAIGVIVAIYRMPLRQVTTGVTVTTDRHGYFSDISLEPGRYLVTANVMGRNASCVIDDVFDGAVTRMQIRIGENGARCSGPRVHSATVNSAFTADVYIIR